jgi:hypothetical protein
VLTRSREQRRNLRRFTRRAATLTLGDQKPSVDCVIWDISEGGARFAIGLPMSDLSASSLRLLCHDLHSAGAHPCERSSAYG